MAESKKRARPADTVDVVEAAPSRALTTGLVFSPVSLTSWGLEDRSLLHLNAHVLPAAPERPCVAIAAFDMDDTLVFPKSGKVFAQSRADWQWLSPAIPLKLRELHATGYAIAIISNQGGIGQKAWDESKANEIRGKILDLAGAAGVPISACCAAKEDQNRKPGTEMWDFLTGPRMLGASMDIDKTRSFYVGDAAGRAIMTMAGRKKDFSCSDRKFAYNVGVKFYTPEEYWLGQSPAEFDWDGISPAELLDTTKAVAPALPFAAGTPKVVVIMVGYPGSGKSTYYHRNLKPLGFVHANRDTLKTKEKCAQVLKESLAAGKSVCVDNTSPEVADRKMYIDLAKNGGASLIVCITMTASKALANHMNIMRARLLISDRVSSIAFNIFKSKFVEPSVREGFDHVLQVPVVPDFAGLPANAKAIFFQLS